MSRLIEFRLDDGTTAFVEAESEGGVVSASRGPGVERAQQSFSKAIGAIRPVAATIIDEIRKLQDTPDMVSVEFGLKMSSEAGAVIAISGGISHFKVILTWNQTANRDQP